MEKYISIYILILLLAILASLSTGCDDTNLPSNEIIIYNISNALNKTYKSKYIYVKDISKYDKSFIDGLIEYSLSQKSHLKLIDDLLTVDNENYSLSSEIESDKIYFFEKFEMNKHIRLVLFKYNLSSLKFSLRITIDGKINFEKSGVVTLSPCFFLGADSDDDEETGSSFFVTTYRHEDKKGYIYISVGENDKNLLQARVKTDGIANDPVLYLNKVMPLKQ